MDIWHRLFEKIENQSAKKKKGKKNPRVQARKEKSEWLTNPREWLGGL